MLYKDVFYILGPSPCLFDIRLWDVISAEEIYPFSPTKIMILKEMKPSGQYLNLLAWFLKMQAASLGETGNTKTVFTCLSEKKLAGFNFDFGGMPSSPTCLIATPVEMPQKLVGTAFGLKPEVLRMKFIQHCPTLFNTDAGVLIEQFATAMLTKAKLFEDTSDSSNIGRMKTMLANYRRQWLKPVFAGEINIAHKFETLLHSILVELVLRNNRIRSFNTFDLVDDLIQGQILTPLTGVLFKDTFASLYALHIRLQFLHQEDSPEGYFPGSDQVAGTITPTEKENLEQCYWLVLRPLYSALADVLENEIPFEKAFHKLDCIDKAFNEILSTSIGHDAKRCLVSLVRYLLKANFPLQTHIDYYKNIGQRLGSKILQQTYLEAIGSRNMHVLTILQNIPDMTGYRYLSVRKGKKLQEALQSLTHSQPPRNYLEAHRLAQLNKFEECYKQFNQMKFATRDWIGYALPHIMNQFNRSPIDVEVNGLRV